MNPNEPLGLPNGSIRDLLTFLFTGSVVYLWVTGQPVDVAHLSIATLIVGNYFGTRGTTDPAPASPEQIAPPYIPEDQVQ